MNELIFRFFNNLAGQSVFFDTIIIALASYLAPLLAVGFVFYLVLRFRKGDRAFFMTATHMVAVAAGGWIVSQIIKRLVASPRPFLALSDVNQLLIHGNHDSFPSGHATFFFALGFALSFHSKKLGAPFLIGALFIGIARVIAGVHWPGDIVGGYVLGLVIVLGVHYFVGRRAAVSRRAVEP